MAFPVSIPGIAAAVPGGPYKSSAGAIYFIGYAGSTVQAYKGAATDPSDVANWSAAGSSFTVSPGTGIYGWSSYQVGDVIHVVTQGRDTTSRLRYHAFDMSTDSWTTQNEQIRASDISTGTAGAYGPSIVVRSNGDIVVGYQGATNNVMGKAYTRVVYARKAGGAWTTDVAVDGETSTVNWLSIEHGAVLGSSDRTHFFLEKSATTPELHQRTLTGSNTLGTRGLVKAGAGAEPDYAQQGTSYSSGLKVRYISGDGAGAVDVHKFDSADTPSSYSTDADVGDARTVANSRLAALAADGTTLYALFESGDEIYYRSNTNDAGWGSENVADSTGFSTLTTLAGARVYSRGGNIVLALLFVGNDTALSQITVGYHEITLRADIPTGSATTSQTQSSSAQASVSISATAATLQAQSVAGAGGGSSVTVSVAAAQAQSIMAAAGVSAAVTVTASQAQSSAGAASLASTVSASTAQGQSTAASAGVAIFASATSAQTQSAQAALALAWTATVGSSQAQSATAAADLSQAVSVASAQAQIAAASGTVAVAASASTAQAQSAEATVAVAIASSVATAQVQTASAAATVAASAAVATSQAQSAVAEGAVSAAGLEVSIATSQAQSSAAVAAVQTVAAVQASQAQSSAGAAVVASAATVQTSQAQSTSASAQALTLWSIINSAIDLQDDPDGNNSANYSFTGNTLLPGLGATTTGNGIVVLVSGHWRTDGTPTITVTDNAGNTYTAASELYVGSGTPAVHIRSWMQAFYCANATGDANLIPQFDVTVGSATVFDLPSRMLIAAFEVQSDGAIVPDVEEWHSTVSGSTTITSDAFSTTEAGAVFALQANFQEDSVASSTVNFESDYTDLPRPGRLASTGFPDNTWGAAGYRVTSGALSSEQVTFTGNNSTTRTLLVVAFKAASDSVVVSVTTSQAQSAQAQASAAWDSTGSTAQVQSASAAVELSWPLAGGTAQAQSAAVAGESQWPLSGGASQAQSASAEAAVAVAVSAAAAQAQSARGAAVVIPIIAATAQAQSAAVAASVGDTAQSATSQAQRSAAQAAISIDASASAGQAQSVAGQAGVSIGAAAALSQAQSAAAELLAAHVASASAAQAQNAAAQASVGIAAEAATSQAQQAQAQGATSIAASVATSQAQAADGRLRRELDGAAETAQRQSTSGQVGARHNASVSTAQAQSAEAGGATAIACSATTGQAQSVQWGRLVVGMGCTVGTSQVGGSCAGVLVQFVPQLGALSCQRRLTRAVQGSADAALAVQGGWPRVLGAVRGRTEARAAMATRSCFRPAVRGHPDTRPQP